MGSPKSRKTFWGEEEQRNERDLPLAAGRGIWSLRRRSERENAVQSEGRNDNRAERYKGLNANKSKGKTNYKKSSPKMKKDGEKSVALEKQQEDAERNRRG